MTNTNAPFGFKETGVLSGSAPNFAVAQGAAAYNAGAMYQGDVLDLSSGLLVPDSVVGGGAPIAGIAVGFSWVSIAQKRRVFQNYYPNSDSVDNANITVHYMAAVGSQLFIVQSDNENITQANIGQFANWAAGAGGNTYTGMSSAALDAGSLTGTQGDLPFQVVSLLGAPQTDPAATYNQVVVRCVNSRFPD